MAGHPDGGATVAVSYIATVFTRTVVTRLAGEEIGRDRSHLDLDHRARVAPPDYDFIAQACLLLNMRGLSRDDLERAEFEVIDTSSR